MLRLRVILGICLVAWSASALVAPAAEDATTSDVLQARHAWARFGEGSWRQVRVLTETFDELGNVTSSSLTDNVTTLENVGPEGVTLKVEATVEIAGQRIASPPRVLQQGFAGEKLGQTVSIKSLGDDTVTVEGQEIPCQAQQIEILGAGNKEVIQISYALESTPAILRRKSTTSDTTSGETTEEALTEVFALNRRLRVLDEASERRGYRMRQVLKTPQSTTTMWSDHVADIPGEVVAHSSQKFDEQGRLVRRTTLTLVDYGVEEAEHDFGNLSRRQRRKMRRGR